MANSFVGSPDTQSHAFRIGFWYLLGAISLTVLWPAALGLAPDAGLTRSYWYPVNASTEPIIDEHITAIDLAFIDERHWPTRNYRVRWDGVWFSPRAERVDFYAGADDGVILRVDGDTILERNPAVGMHTVARTVELAAGTHRLEIEHWQDGGARSLNVQWGPDGGTPALLGPTRLFPEDPGALGYWLRIAAMRWPVLVLLVWAAGVAVLVGLTVWRAFYRKVTSLSPDERWRRLRTVLFPALLGPSQLLLFGPWTVHETNRTEFLAGFWELAPGWIWLLGPVVGVLAGLSIVMPTRWFPRYVAGLCAVGVLLWAQGNLLLADYGLLDGGGLDLASHAWRTPFEAGLWVGVLVLAVAFAGVVTRVAPVACVALVTLQATVLMVPVGRMATADALSPPGAETGWRLPPPEIYELSATRNLIHIVLDTFPTYTFVDILEADRSTFDRDWSGFTFFPDHLGAYVYTKGSMPAMLSGVAFRNEMPFAEFLGHHPSIFHALGQQGYRLRSLTSFGNDHPSRSFPGADATIRYDIPNPYGSYRDYVDVTVARLLDLSLFRHAPHALKPGIYRNQQWLFQQRIALRGPEAADHRAFGDTMFLRDFAAQVTAGDDKPVYTLLHVLAPHLAVATDADCNSRLSMHPVQEEFSDQARCALLSVRALFDRLRALDLYDRSAIIVTSDHGWSRFMPEDQHPTGGMRTPARVTLAEVEAFAAPLLLVKPFGARGLLRTSYVPTAITDIPSTVLDIADLPDTLGRGTSVFRIDPAARRQRTYAHHTNRPNRLRSPFFDALYVFSVNGRVTEPDAWSFHQTVFGPTDDRATQRREYSIGLSAVQDDTARQPGTRVYRTDEYAVFYAAPQNSNVTFDIRRMPAMATAQTVEVRIDGEVVDRRVLTDDAWHTLSYPVKARSEDSPFGIELLTSPVWYDATGESWGPMLRGDI